MFSAHELTTLHREMVALWHEREIANPYTNGLSLVCEQHKFNFLLWHEEDIARSREVGDARIAGAKRAIDGYNQQRNDWIEKIDDFLVDEIERLEIQPKGNARFNTETPGCIIDRLSILSLRLYHMEEQATRADASEEHRNKVRLKLEVLYRQHHDLEDGLAELFDDLSAGRKQMRVYRQFKMYNDPTLNPYLYGKRRAG